MVILKVKILISILRFLYMSTLLSTIDKTFGQPIHTCAHVLRSRLERTTLMLINENSYSHD